MSSYKSGYNLRSGPSRKLHSPKYAQKKRNQKTAVIFLFVLCFVTLTASGFFFVRSSFFIISNIVIRGSDDLPSSLIRETVLAALPPSESIFFVPKEAIKKAVLSHFPEVEDLSVNRSGFKELTLVLRRRVPAAVVCFGFRDDTASTTDENDISDCYLSDHRGYIFEPVASSTGADSLGINSFDRYYVPTDNAESPLGTSFVTEDRLGELEHFVEGARQGGLIPLGILVGDDGDYEMYIKNKKGDSEVTIYFDDKQPFDTVLSNLLTFWGNPLDSKNKKATTTQAFDYINLRFGNTVYYSTE